MNILYADNWNRKLICPRGLLTEEAVLQRFENGPWFVVVVGNNIGEEGIVPEYVLEVTPRAEFIRARFFNQSGSQWLTYDFRKHDDKLFLETVMRHEYADDTHHMMFEATLVETVRYTSDGTAQQSVNDTSKLQAQTSELTDVDVSKHWEPVPQFGDWTSLGRIDRTL